MDKVLSGATSLGSDPKGTRVVLSPRMLESVRKRDGQLVPFDQSKITSAIQKAMKAAGEGDPLAAQRVSNEVVTRLLKRPGTPEIEVIQDLVEGVLMETGFPKTSKRYILYRNERAQLRERRKLVPEEVRAKIQQDEQYFSDLYRRFIFVRSYARWLEKEGRRATWEETVDRYLGFMREMIGARLTEAEYQELRLAILSQEIMPSMRLLWSAGPACRGNNVVAYNCSYLAVSKLEDFAEVLFLSMCGVGVGFSVERENIERLPIIQRQKKKTVPLIYQVDDTREGWCEALLFGLRAWFEGKDVVFDFSQLRPAGARLKTMGGRSAGSAPLGQLLAFTRFKVLAQQGKRLQPIDVHDIICKIGECVVTGGVRRTALISLSDLDDREMRKAKSGSFDRTNPQRSMANNSAVYRERPTDVEFLEEWLHLAKSGTGERGIFNRGGLKHQLPKRRRESFEKHQPRSGTNPCGEIILRNKQFCNLTEVVARPGDTLETLKRKIRLATILGTYQATLTDFPYLSSEWRKNCEEERLLGVSITGQWDCPVVRQPEVLSELRDYAIVVNREYAKRFGINEAAAITCVKPSGTVSQLVNCASGMHPRYAKHYIRRVRISASDPLFKMLRDQKFPICPEVGQLPASATTFVLEFPIRAPEGAVTKDDLTAIEQLEHWKMVKELYTEHNPSTTILVEGNEWLRVGYWLLQNWKIVGGLSFLPRGEHSYQLAPYEEITLERYEEMVAKMTNIDFSLLVAYEQEDQTTGNGEWACVSGACEL